MKLMDRRAILVLTDGDRQGLGSEGAVKPDLTKYVQRLCNRSVRPPRL
jgi:hypothetical protein